MSNDKDRSGPPENYQVRAWDGASSPLWISADNSPPTSWYWRAVQPGVVENMFATAEECVAACWDHRDAVLRSAQPASDVARALSELIALCGDVWDGGIERDDWPQIRDAAIDALERASPAPAKSTDEKLSECTGQTASWCPRCGDCVCPRDAEGGCDFDTDECPLHGGCSDHASPAPESKTNDWRCTARNSDGWRCVTIAGHHDDHKFVWGPYDADSPCKCGRIDAHVHVEEDRADPTPEASSRLTDECTAGYPRFERETPEDQVVVFSDKYDFDPKANFDDPAPELPDGWRIEISETSGKPVARRDPRSAYDERSSIWLSGSEGHEVLCCYACPYPPVAVLRALLLSRKEP